MAILKPFRYLAPTRTGDALAYLKKGGRLLAGGTLLINALKRAEKPPFCVVSLRRVPGLTGVREVKAGLVIGAMTTLADLENSALLREHLPSLADACRSVATTPIRHRATLGGNIACRFFWTDLPAVLISLEATLVLASPRGLKRIAAQDYPGAVTGPHILLRVEVPKFSGRAFVRRHTRSMEVDLPILVVAGRVLARAGTVTSVRLVVNPTTSRPFVLQSTGDLLKETGVPGEKSLEAALARDLTGQKIDSFKLRLLKEDIQRFLGECRTP